MKDSLWVLIPAYNEEKMLGAVIRALKEKGVSVLVIDDGSTDQTASVATACGAEVIKNTTNVGKGGSLKRGIEYLMQRHDFEAVITMDGDGQHNPREIELLVKAMRDGNDFVVGNRMSHPQGMPLMRLITNKCMSLFISLLCRQHIPDTQCGFRLIKKRVLENIFIVSEKFEVESELLLKAAYNGVSISSVPISSIYSRAGVSNIRPFKDTARFLIFVMRWYWREIFSEK